MLWFFLLPVLGASFWKCESASSSLIAQSNDKASRSRRSVRMHRSRASGLPAGVSMMWEDRGKLSPTKVYWGPASIYPDPLSRLPAPPFSHFEKVSIAHAASPKARVTDSKGVKWTVKLGTEVHSDVAAPRLAWALGLGTVEGYYVGSGNISGVNARTDLGHAKGSVKPDGTFTGGARFKRHNKNAEEVHDLNGSDLTWNQGRNPGVSPEYLSAMLLFDVLVSNWDAQPKNCKVLHVSDANGLQNWFIIGDYGASFADHPWGRFVLKDYQKQPNFINGISKGFVDLKYSSTIRAMAKIHQRIPIAHAQWFRKRLEKLTDDDVQAAFDAAFATDALNRAYASSYPKRIKEARERELPLKTRQEIAGFVTKFREKINEYLSKIPADDLSTTHAESSTYADKCRFQRPKQSFDSAKRILDTTN
jgi:hypothetical protein